MNFNELSAALPKTAVTSIDGLPFTKVASGKVREIFDLGDALLLAATDRLSAFDVILPDGIPGKGAILTQMSNWWFAQTTHLIPNHLLPDQPRQVMMRGLGSRDIAGHLLQSGAGGLVDGRILMWARDPRNFFKLRIVFRPPLQLQNHLLVIWILFKRLAFV